MRIFSCVLQMQMRFLSGKSEILGQKHESLTKNEQQQSQLVRQLMTQQLDELLTWQWQNLMNSWQQLKWQW